MDGACAPEFGRLLGFMGQPEPVTATEIKYGIWPDFRLAYFNRAWVRFARENGGAPPLMTDECLGLSVLDVTPEVLRPFYHELFTQALASKTTRPRNISHEYECSSPDAYRRFAMTLYPLEAGQGLLIANSLVVEMPHEAQGTVAMEPAAHGAAYLDQHALVIQCAACRRVKHQRIVGRWDWVPAWVRHPPEQTSHGLCDLCLEYYYPPKQ